MSGVASDTVLAESVRQGQAAAFSLLVARYRDPVYVIVRNMLASPADCAEAVNETFLSAYRRLSSQTDSTPFATALYRIAIAAALARRVHPRSMPCTPAPALREALEFLEDEVRAAFFLRDLLELPIDEVAAVLLTSPAEVRRRVHRARLLLRAVLERIW